MHFVEGLAESTSMAFLELSSVMNLRPDRLNEIVINLERHWLLPTKGKVPFNLGKVSANRETGAVQRFDVAL